MSTRLHRPAYEISFDVQNTGNLSGGDVRPICSSLPFKSTDDSLTPSQIPQLYTHLPPSAAAPPSLLKGFTNVELKPKEQKRVAITLSRYDLSVWDVVAQGWKKPEGAIALSVRRSSRDVQLKGQIP
jgi:hypothetical protein